MDNYGIGMPVFDEVIDDINRASIHLWTSVRIKEEQREEKEK